jgi:hypothetical protein
MAAIGIRLSARARRFYGVAKGDILYAFDPRVSRERPMEVASATKMSSAREVELRELRAVIFNYSYRPGNGSPDSSAPAAFAISRLGIRGTEGSPSWNGRVAFKAKAPEEPSAPSAPSAPVEA